MLVTDNEFIKSSLVFDRKKIFGRLQCYDPAGHFFEDWLFLNFQKLA